MTDAPRTIGVATEYDHQVAIARARMVELGFTFAELDTLSGVQAGYSAKVLGPKPSKRLGPVSFGPIMGALGIAWHATHDPQAAKRSADRAEKSNWKKQPTYPLSMRLQNPELIEVFKLLGAKGGTRRKKRLSKARRQAIARLAIKHRWRQTKWWERRASRAAGTLPKA